jgi:tetratricopeptide (TPR) repeat protein
MSLLSKLFGRRSATEERERADELFARGELGLAKLGYERALELATSAPAGSTETDTLKQELRARVDACRDALASARIAEAERLLAEGAHELAASELLGAAEMAASPELVAKAERRLETAERTEARAHATAVEQTEDERFETIAGSWEEAQYEEYAAHGPELRAALLALYEGDAGRARPVLERLVESAASPHYLWFELGRARLLEGQSEGGREALRRFVAGFEGDEGGEARLVAHMELATLHHDAGDFDAAAAEYEAAVDAMPDDPRPYLALAGFLRREGLPRDAIEVLASATAALEEDGQRQFRLTLERGLAHMDLGEDERAIALLEEVVTYLTARQHLDLPPECAVPLAQLHEKRGNKARALDLYNLLAAGSDLTHHADYYRQAARLLLELGHRPDARRMLQRVAELVSEDPEARAAVERQLAELK